MHIRALALSAVLAAVLVTPPLSAATDAPSIVKLPDAYFTSVEGRKTVDDILTWQGHGPSSIMAWPKAYHTEVPRPDDGTTGAGAKLEWDGIATIDNGATYSELRILARAITLESLDPKTDKERLAKIKAAFYKGLDAILDAQYKNGGWAQRFPPNAPNQAAYAPHITFNDNAMIRLLDEIKLAGEAKAPYAFIDDEHKKKSQAAFDKAVDCILKCQIVIDGKLTGWCAQHDEVTLKPAGGRAYELVSISGQEGAEIVVLLMQIDKPDDRLRKAIDGAAAWFDSVKIVGKKSVSATGPDGKKDRILEDDPTNTTWARFYDIETGKPMFSGRDGVKKFSLDEIEAERRTGYSWYGNWGTKVAKDYIAWKKKNPAPATAP